MSGLEALSHLKQGHKMRMIKWPSGAYIESGGTWVQFSHALCWYYLSAIDSPQESQYKLQEIMHDIMSDDDWEVVNA